MGMHRDLSTQKVLQSTILSAEFNSILRNKNLPNQLGTLMIISLGKGYMYLSRLFLLV